MSAKTQHNKAQHNPRIFTLAFLLLASFSLFASAGLNLNVTLTEPANAANSSAGGFTFTFVPTIQNDTGIDATNFSNASIWVANTSALAAGVPGVNWALNQTVNATQALRNATAYSITVSGLSQGNYVWSANVSTNYSGTGGASNFSLTGTNLVSVFNRTFNIDNTAPNSPASVSISSGANVSNGSISYTPSDAVTGVANSTVWVFNNSGNANN
ncbi:hypothetical protein HY995_04215, partial [Candidatus Micrarchaeota archaeon]|nr:hypothetical protein [Candidatus Micrarchaeota archaeon]